MADWLTLLSAFIVVFAFFFLGVFISRLGVLEARAFAEPVVRGAMDIPAKTLVEVRNPFAVKLVEDGPSQKGTVSFLLSNTVPCYVTAFWGVPALSIDNLVPREPNATQSDDLSDDDDDDYDDDDDDEQKGLSQTIPIHRILSGSYESKGSMEYYNPGQEQLINVPIPAEFESQLEKLFSQKPNGVFPLVFVAERSRNLSQEEKNAVKSCDVVALITALSFSKSSKDLKEFRVTTQYIQIADGNIFPLKKLYVSDSQPTDVSVNNMDSTQAPDSTVPSPTCVVCHSMPISRVLLPCRHACVCGLCFSKLEAKCPMCRHWIESYFITLEEPELMRNELETSRELNAMSASEILQGIFRAS